MCQALVVTFIVQTIIFTMAAVISTTIFLTFASPSLSGAAVVKSDLLRNITEDIEFGDSPDEASCISQLSGETNNCSETENISYKYCCEDKHLNLW